MKKLRLEDLQVDSFEVNENRAEKGTVEGYDGISLRGSCPAPCTNEASYCVCETLDVCPSYPCA